MYIDITQSKSLYSLLVAAVSPRPIAWVSTLDNAGRYNLAPYSFFNVVSVDPPVLAFSPLNKEDGESKDTLNNIRQNHQCVINVVSRDLAEQMNHSSVAAPADIDERQLTGLTLRPSHHVKVGGIAEAQINFECRLRDIISFGDNKGAGQLVLVNIVGVYVNDELFDSDGHIAQQQLDVIGRIAGNDYVGIGDRFALDRPDWPATKS